MNYKMQISTPEMQENHVKIITIKKFFFNILL